MIYLELFLSFVKIGFTSFGGMSMVPVIMEEMGRHGWMSAGDISNLIAIAEMTPGSLGVNCATFAGTQTAGFLGGLAAVTGVLTPAFTLTLAVAVFFARLRTGGVMKAVLTVVKPICIGMILLVILTLGEGSFFPQGRFDYVAVLIAVVCFVLIRWKKVSVPLLIGLSAAMGIVCYGLLGLG